MANPTANVLDKFHPVVAGWFAERFREPTEPQRLGWPEILAGRDTLIAAPTGSGKTLAAFLAAIDQLWRQRLAGELADRTQVVYVSPLKALSNDIRRNLEAPLAEIAARAIRAGYTAEPLTARVRTGDTPASERQAMLRRPPHLLVTTPESLYLLLTAEKSREMLRGVRTVIVDEIHALARDKRGSHLALSLERLAELCPRPPVRIGLSATQRPMDEIARFLTGARRAGVEGEPPCSIVDTGHIRELDLAIEVPPSELAAVCSNECWAEVYRRVADLVSTHRATLVFVNTRRMAERVSHHLGELLGAEYVASHHGSLSKALRLAAEQRLQSGEVKAIVATASLELGIDVGSIDLACQIGSPRSISTFLQRIGRAGHSLGATPKGRLFALTRDELLECMALVRAVRRGQLDCIEIPPAPLDVLAQQIVASVAAEEWSEDGLFDLCRRAWPYRDLRRQDFDDVVQFLSEGLARGMRAGAYLHRDAIHRRLRPRRGARLAALGSPGAIPENADYRVVTEEGRTFVGTVNEDFAIESMAGDIFQLGNTSWRIRRVSGGEVTVSDAQGAPSSIPFWLGEAPGRTFELSAEVSQLRTDLAAADAANSPDWLSTECGADGHGARQALAYVAAQQAAMGVVPTQRQIVFERFFDESGGMQLVIHSPLGMRINRAWGLALRKRFCRSFDFELQASADDNGIVLSLGPQHSFPIDALFRMLNRENAEPLLVQALLAVPLFRIRWRWNATRALAVPRTRGGKRVPPPLQRFRADDALTAVFPAQTACQENVTGDIEVPNHPLVAQTVFDCLHEAMDVTRWLQLIRDIEEGRVESIARDTREPSPFSHQLLNANPYAFLDPAPLEERRARAVATRRSLAIEDVSDLGRLDPEAIARVRAEAKPVVRNADELHDYLLSVVALPVAEGADWQAWFGELVAAGRATVAHRPDGGPWWVAAERWPLVAALAPETQPTPKTSFLSNGQAVESADALAALLRGRLEFTGPMVASQLAAALGLPQARVEAGLAAVEGEGAVLQGRFDPDLPAGLDGAPAETQWCNRRLLARIHRLTLHGARQRIQPVAPADYWRFLLEHQRMAAGCQLEGRQGLREAIAQLQGFEAPAGAWERDLLPARLPDFEPRWLDELSMAGELAWGRLQPPDREGGSSSGAGLTRVAPLALFARGDLAWLLPPDRAVPLAAASASAQAVYDVLRQQGAIFLPDLLALSGLLPAQLHAALGELAALGLATADGFAPVRALAAETRLHERARRRGRESARRGPAPAGGRWSCFPGRLPACEPAERLERWANLLLHRYGVVFRDLLAREDVAPPWHALVPLYRRWEAQGRLRGGRFIQGVGGEQFAKEETVERLRAVRDRGPTGAWSAFSACDPLNLAGILSPGARVPATLRNALAVRDGESIAWQQAGRAEFAVSLEPAQAEEVARAMRVATCVRVRVGV